tara:strand:- start:12 stop:224 length:213 start_codon:yes stop_codon:yes gene_type:complete
MNSHMPRTGRDPIGKLFTSEEQYLVNFCEQSMIEDKINHERYVKKGPGRPKLVRDPTIKIKYGEWILDFS